MRNHWHALLILPLIVIVMTWPTFARIFDADEFWLHSRNTSDAYLKFWDTWHLERVLAGQSEYFYTDAMFHPHGISLALRAMSTPHSLLMLVLKQALAADDAYSFLYLLMLCFNAFCVYWLIHHLLRDKWIALFGAVIVGVNCWFTDYNTVADVLMVGTIPLTLYFLHRSVMENQWRFAALAGICAGVTAFIGLYLFLFVLITAAIYALYLALTHWQQPAFWKRMLLLLFLCGMVSSIRIYPFVAEPALFAEASERYLNWKPGEDVLDFLLLSRNPFLGDFLHSLFNAKSNHVFRNAYLGYINIVFCGLAILHKPTRRRLAPWLALFVIFALLRLGDYLVVNDRDYSHIVLPEHVLSNLFPTLIGQVGGSFYYQIGIVTPLAVLSCYGLYVLLRNARVKVRAAVAILSIAVLCIEYYLPRDGFVLESKKTDYIEWLRSENESQVKVIDLPQGRERMIYHQYAQSLSGYATAYGQAHRNRASARSIVNRNYLLRTWRNHQPTICLPLRNSPEYIAALDKLLQYGFTHIVFHQWQAGEEDLSPSFAKVDAAYQNEYVSVFRLADMRQNCEPPPLPPAIDRFSLSNFVLPGNGSAILSYHASEGIDSDTLAYIGLLLSNWESFHHLYQHNGEWVTQSAGLPLASVGESAQNWRIVYLVYDASDRPPTLPASIEFRNNFNLCRPEAYEEGSVIELWLNPRFSCALVEPSDSPRVEYDNGAKIENLLHEFKQDIFDLQILWRNLPDTTHSLSVQVFNDGGDKVHGQDFVIGSRSITGHSVDLSSLPPGDYIVKLIFYRYSTGQSVAGASSSSGGSFERALTIATIHKT